MPRDSQRQAVYNWEDKLAKLYPDSLEPIGLELSIALINSIWREYVSECGAPRVGDGRGRRGACYSPRLHAIKLPRWARSTLIVCHETAHAIAGIEGGWHGPKFCNLVVELWENYCGIPQREARTIGTELKPRKVSFVISA
jgi:hypothetical protein